MQYDVLAFLAAVGEEGRSASFSEKIDHETHSKDSGAIYLGEICEDGGTNEYSFNTLFLLCEMTSYYVFPLRISWINGRFTGKINTHKYIL